MANITILEALNRSLTATKKYVDDKIPHYNETLMFEISGEDHKLFINNSYFNMSALNIDETKIYVGKEMSSNEKYSHKFVYDKEADALICEDTLVNIYNHKSYNGTNFTDDENSAVLTFNISLMDMVSEGEGYFRLYEIDKVELDNNCLSDNVIIANSLTVGERIGDIGLYSVAEGGGTTASGSGSHAEGGSTTASGTASHSEGSGTTASGEYSHAEGGGTEASGEYSHAEGNGTIANGDYSHAEGGSTTARGEYSHAEGTGVTADGYTSHAEGNSTTASGAGSHAEGDSTTANGNTSHAEGYYTKASGQYQHVQGQYNIEDTTNTYAHIVGNGTADNARSNAHTLDWNGNAWYQGKLSQDGTPTEDKDLTTKKYVDDKEAFKSITSESSSPIIINDLSADGLYKLSGDFKIFAEDESTVNLSGLFILEEKDVTTKALRLLNNNGAYLSTSYVLDTSAKTYTIKKNEQISFISAQNNILILKDLAGGVIYETTALGAKINPDDDVILNLGASGRKLVRVTKGRNTQTGITTWLVNVFGSDMLWGQLTVDSNGVITKNECFQYIKNNNVLTLSNTTEYTPTNDYNPATKKYVDDKVAEANASGGYTHPDSHPASMITGLATVATSGSYNDLNDKPTIPDVSDKANISGQVFTGAIEAPTVIASTYFRTPALVGEGDNSAYYHRVNFGYQNHDYWEFHEYGGDYRFYENKNGTAAGGTMIANIKSTYSDFKGEVRENGTRVYSPNNKPTADDLGITIPSIDGLATETYVNNKVAGLIDSAPEALNTLNELATALGNDANFATTISNQIGLKANSADLAIVATSGSYNDLSDKPTIPAAYTHPASHPASMITGLHTVATSGDYNDLNNKPSIPTVTNDLTNKLKANYDAAYTHSTSAHAPSNAQKNSDITKAEIEAKLTGNITTHTHSQYLTSIPSEYITEQELTSKGYAAATTHEEVKTTVNQILGGAYIE